MIDNNYEKPALILDETGKGYLYTIAKWNRFFAILGYVLIGFLILMGVGFLAFSSTLASIMANNSEMRPASFLFMGGGAASFSYFLIALFYFFPVNYLYKFSKTLRIALDASDQQLLNDAFKNFKSYHKFIGILCIVILSIYLLTMLSGIFFGAALLMAR